MKVKHLKSIFLTLFIFSVVVSYSWMPIAFFSMPLICAFVFFIPRLKILNLVFLTYVIIITMIFITLERQIIYIEWARNILFVPLVVCSYIIGSQLAENPEYIKKTLIIFLFSSVFLVLYTFLFVIPMDIPLFIGERRGYLAREFLLFGRLYEFSLGVTHLNMYINLVFSLLLVCIIYSNSSLLYGCLVFFVILALLTQSRSPILFLLIISSIYTSYRFKVSSNKTLFVSIFSCLILLLGALAYVLISMGGGESNTRFSAEGMSDMSRFIFYAKGIEHLLLEPWGNSLLYTDETMPLLNYHNTFLAIGNRMGFVVLICFLILFIFAIFDIRKLKSIRFRTSLYVLLYFCFHNFMIEDVIKFDSFVILFFLVLVPFVRRYRFIEKRMVANG